MCDTFAALPGHTCSGHLIFGKNSDREPNEAQAILRVPATEQPEKRVRCTYISIPQVRHTFEVVLSKPFQMWGAEMGVNEHGLVIGNEAVFTRIKFARKNTGLTGMDMLRLALERCKTAEQAIETITSLLAAHGQDACGGYQNRNFFYSNSFLIADLREAWVLETAGGHWAAQKVKSGFRSISNILTITTEYDFLSAGTVDFAQQKGWLKRGEDFSFKKALSDWFYTTMGRGGRRQSASTEMGKACAGVFDLQTAMEILSAHQPPGEEFLPAKCSTASICMHATGLANPSNTTGSMVAEIRQGGPHTVWLTGTSMPCLSVWKPFFFPAGGGRSILPGNNGWELPGATPDDSLWWQAERLHREIRKDYPEGARVIKNGRQALQQKLLTAAGQITAGQTTPSIWDDLSNNALAEYLDLLGEWKEKLPAGRLPERSFNLFYRIFQRKINKVFR